MIKLYFDYNQFNLLIFILIYMNYLKLKKEALSDYDN